MADKSYQLVIRDGPNAGKVFELTSNEVVIGRDNKNDFPINDAELSRRHARLYLQGDGYVIEDLGSTNGTFVNGQRITAATMLKAGQSIRLGETIALSFELSGFDPDATVAAGKRARPAAASAASPQPPVQNYAGQVARGPSTAASILRGNRNLAIGVGVVLVIGACAIIAFLWYIDVNRLWCDVFGTLISGC